ncbi:hypothetical protein BDZ89DRAFT_1055075 [Hymenopellis radicata]|nr:hypothetical protein BDZ89DRAFT_1055075 [Hymenopellis radicata]
MGRPKVHHTPEEKREAAREKNRRWYQSHRSEALAAMKVRYDREAAKLNRRRRVQAPKVPTPKYFDELLCKRLLRRARHLDADRRIGVVTADKYARELVAKYLADGHDRGSVYVFQMEEHFRGMLDSVSEWRNDIENEAGVDNIYWRDITEIYDRFKILHDYIDDIWFHVERRSLQSARKKEQLLYQQQ